MTVIIVVMVCHLMVVVMEYDGYSGYSGGEGV